MNTQPYRKQLRTISKKEHFNLEMRRCIIEHNKHSDECSRLSDNIQYLYETLDAGKK